MQCKPICDLHQFVNLIQIVINWIMMNQLEIILLFRKIIAEKMSWLIVLLQLIKVSLMSWILNWNSLIFRSLLYIIFFLDLILLFYGLYINNNGVENGEKTIGISVLIFCFLFMPLFLYYRYRNKKLDDYIYKD